MPAKKQSDWPAIAAAIGASISLSWFHPAALERARRSSRNAAWGVAFSGGADSLALLLLLWSHFPERRSRLVALHFNHRLRGRASGDDARFCARVCAALGVRCVVGEWKGRRKTARGPSEAEARAVRHAFFAEAIETEKIRLLWLAHQEDDIAESMLMRLARGSGTAGLAAPRPVTEFGDGRVYVRPLLTLAKADLVRALKAAKAPWREDVSNASDKFFRNRVRRVLVPAWTKLAGRDALSGAALSRERLDEDDCALEAWLDELAPFESRGRVLRVDVLAGKPSAVWRRALHRWLLAARPDTDLSRQGFEQLLAVVRRGRDTRFSLGIRSFAVIRSGKLRLQRM